MTALCACRIGPHLGELDDSGLSDLVTLALDVGGFGLYVALAVERERRRALTAAAGTVRNVQYWTDRWGRVAFYGEPIKGKQRLGIPAGHTLPIDVPVPVTPDPFADRVLGMKVLPTPTLEYFGKIAPDNDEERWKHFLPKELGVARWLESRGVSVLSVDTFKSPWRPTPDAIVKVDDLPPAEFKIMQPKSGSFSHLQCVENVELIALKCRRGIVDLRGTDASIVRAERAMVDAVVEHGVNLDELVFIVNGSHQQIVSVGWSRG